MFDIGFPRDWSSLKKLIWLKAAISGGGSSAVWKTVTGALIHITNALASPMQKCEVSLEPIQDLHGQDAPYPAGGWKNLAYLEQGTINMATGAEESSTTRVRTQFIPVSVGVNYMASSQNNGWSIRNGVGYDENKSYVSNGVYPDSTNGRYTVLNPDIKYVRFVYSHVNTSESCSPSDYWYQFERGTTPTAYSPYSNICPITGGTGCEVYRTGVNVWDEEWEVGGYADSNGNPWETSDRIRSKKENYISIKPSTTYYFYCGTDSNFDMYFYGLDKSYVSHVSRTRNVIFITPANAYYMRFATYNAYGTTYNHDISINYPSTDTSYHAYSGTTLSVTFPDSAGTVYGGTVDLVSGLLTVDRGIITYNGSDITLEYGSFYGMPCRSTTISNFKRPSSSTSLSGIKSNYLKEIKQASTWGVVGTFSATTVDSRLYVCIDSSIDSQNTLNQYLAEHPLTFCYELATPTEIQLTPQEISTLAGENNVWGDGTIELTYKAKAS